MVTSQKETYHDPKLTRKRSRVVSFSSSNDEEDDDDLEDEEDLNPLHATKTLMDD